MTDLETSGPQEERSKRLMYSTSDLGTLDNREVVLPVDFRSQEQSYQRKIQQLGGENEFLKNYSQRILCELKRVLIRHGELDQLQSDFGREDKEIPKGPPWFTSEEYMNPLIAAYDLRLKEMEDICDKAQAEVQALALKTNSILGENEQLHSELANAMEKLVVRAESITVTSNGGSIPESECIGELQERIDVLMEENQLIIEQNSSQESEIQNLRGQMDERDQQLMSMSMNFNQATTVVKQLKNTSERLALEKEQCEQRLQHFAAQAAVFENEKEQAQQSLQIVKAATEDLKKRLREYEIALEQMSKKANDAQDAIAGKHQSLAARIRQLTVKLEDKENENTELQDSVTSLQGELESTRLDCEGMLKVLSNMEKQLTEYTSREENVAALEKSCKSKMEEALLDRDQAKTREAQARKEITHLLEQKKVDAVKNVNLTQEAVAEVKTRLLNQLKASENEISSLTQQLVELKAYQEQAQREKEAAMQDLTTVKGLQNSERSSIKDKFNKLLDRVMAAEASKDQACAEELRVSELLDTKTREFETKKGLILAENELLKDRLSALERELQVRRTELREAHHEKDEKERRIDKVTAQMSDLRSELTHQLNHQQEVYQEQIIEQKNRLFHTESELMKFKEKAEKQETSYRLEHDRILTKKTKEIEQLSETAVRLREEKIRLEHVTQELTMKVTNLTSQTASLQQQLTETMEQQTQFQTLLDESERKATDLASQLSITLSKQQQQIRVEKETKTALDRAKLEKIRLERDLENVKSTLRQVKRKGEQ